VLAACLFFMRAEWRLRWRALNAHRMVHTAAPEQQAKTLRK
jgi:hypothetical protein